MKSTILLGLILATSVIVGREATGSTIPKSKNEESYSAPLDESETNLKDWSADVVVHMLNLLEKIHTKLSTLEIRVESLESQAKSSKDSLNDVLRDVAITNSEVGGIKGQVQDLNGVVKEIGSQIRSGISAEIGHLEDRIKLDIIQYRDIAEKRDKDKDGFPSVEKYFGYGARSLKEEYTELSNFITNNFKENVGSLMQALPSPNVTQIFGEYPGCIGDDQLSEKIADKIDRHFARITETLVKNCTIAVEQTEPVATQMSTTSNAAEATEVVTAVSEDTDMPKCEKGMEYEPFLVIQPSQGSVVNVPYLCDSHTNGGGWIIFQRRKFLNLTFNRLWYDYKVGFGSVYGDYWLGLEALHNLTKSGTWRLRVDLIAAEGMAFYAEYDRFSVSGEDDEFRLHLGKYTGSAGDKMAYHNGMRFSTNDNDNDPWLGGNCAAQTASGWWHDTCHSANPNNGTIYWSAISEYFKITSSEMKIRREDGE